MAAIRILTVEDDEDDYTITRDMLAEVGEGQFDLTWAPTYEDAVREIRRTSYDVYLVDYRLGRRSGLDLLCGELQEGRLGPVIILTGQDAEDVDVEAMKHGAAGFLIKSELRSRHLARTLRYAIERHAARAVDTPSPDATSAKSKKGRIVTFIGAKGGMGTTTIAANVAAALASRGLSVCAVEMRGEFGPLSRLVNIAPINDIGGLLALDASLIDQERFESHLCVHSNGLRLLAAPQDVADFGEVRADQALAILDAAARDSDLVIVDLPSNASDVTREVLRGSDLIALVIEREPSALAAARMFVSLMRNWRIHPPIGSVLVSRVANPEAMAPADINLQLDLKRYGVIPAAPELFFRAAITLDPVILAHPGHPVGKALDELALCMLLVR
jgi:Flp pilus assembly CpaE family ATPase